MSGPATPPKPALPPEPPPSYAAGAAEVPALEAKLAADKAYQGVWTGPRADLNLFLTYVSELVASGGASGDISGPLKAKKLSDAAIKLYLIFARVGRLPDDFARKLATHLDTIKNEPHLGTWTPWKKKGEPIHDFTALAAWSRPEDAALLRERLAAKRDDSGPIAWTAWNDKEPPPRPWLVGERAALERLSLLGPLMPEEKARMTSLIEEAKQPKLGKDFKLGDFTYNVKGVTSYTSVGSGFAEKHASEGARFVVVEYTIQNDTKATETVATNDFRIVDAQGREYRPSAEANTALIMSGENKDMGIAEVQPGLKKKMLSAFEMSDEAAKGVFTLVIPEKGLLGTGSVRITLK